MNELKMEDIIQYVENNIEIFHSKRLNSLKNQHLDNLLKRKNHYLFKAKNILTVESLIKNIYDAYLSSQEETLFGDFLEGLAIFVCEKVYGGQKLPKGKGIDMLLEKEGKIYMIEIKSGPHWGNASQINKDETKFC